MLNQLFAILTWGVIVFLSKRYSADGFLYGI